MAAVTETLLRWRRSPGGPPYLIGVVVDPKDFDVDPETEERYPRILGFRIVNPTGRGGEFAWGAKGCLKWPRYIAGGQFSRFIPTPPKRVTLRGFSWDFTPDHVAVMPGSVSNPSLLTSGGNQDSETSTTTAAFTPTADGLLIASWTSNTVATFTFTNDHAGSGDWIQTASLGADLRHSQASAPMGAAPGSGTVTNTYSIASTRKSWIIYEVTGHNPTPTAWLSEVNTGGAETGTTLSVSLAGVAAGNMVISSIAVRGATAITSGTGETELAEASSSALASQRRTQVQYSTDVAHNWSWTGSDENRGVAVEYAAAPLAAAYFASAVIA